MAPILDVTDLRTVFHAEGKTIPAVDGVSFHIDRGETLCLVGESGSGKSVTSLSVMRLIPPPGEYAGGKILFEGEDLLRKTEKEMCAIRGNRIAMIYQEPMTSLNPLFTVGMQLRETLRKHQRLSAREAQARAVEMLGLVGIPDPGQRIREFPWQMSGGMRQRVMIAMGLCCRPRLLIADEPTTALDVTIQAQILDLMRRLKRELDMTILFITHDLGVVAEMADRVAVMYAGRIVEEAPVRVLFAKSRHPYTRGLMDCIPDPGRPRGQLHVISGVVPAPDRYPTGCRFHPRCPYARPLCAEEAPPMRKLGASSAACHFPLGTEAAS